MGIRIDRVDIFQPGDHVVLRDFVTGHPNGTQYSARLKPNQVYVIARASRSPGYYILKGQKHRGFTEWLFRRANGHEVLEFESRQKEG